MLDDFAILVETEDIDARPIFVAIRRSVLITVQYNVVALGDDALEVHAFPGVLLRHTLEIVDERLLPVCYVRIVLEVDITRVPLYRLGGLALVEHQVVEAHHGLLVALELIAHRRAFLTRP
jgi:hypothetical protein